MIFLFLFNLSIFIYISHPHFLRSTAALNLCVGPKLLFICFLPDEAIHSLYFIIKTGKTFFFFKKLLTLLGDIGGVQSF